METVASRSGDPAPWPLAMATIGVMAVTVALRLPSCHESFWVDELHSAWTVWGTFAEVWQRADLGHQSPFYFLGLWFWKQAVGGSEVALRASSVLAVAIASGIVTWGLARATACRVAGLTAGVVMAIESNSLFYGTELRPYAWVILFAAIAIIAGVRLWQVQSRHDAPRSWIALVVAVLLATLCQPTTLGVLVWLPLGLAIRWWYRDRARLWRCTAVDLVLAAAWVLAGLVLWQLTLGESWDQRQAWAAFASATNPIEIWRAWDWTWLWIWPLAVVIGGRLWATMGNDHQSSPDRVVSDFTRFDLLTGALAVWALLATVLYWVVAYAEWFPLWHRRYFIAVLPVLAVLVGMSVASVAQHRGRWSAVASIAVAAGLISGLAIAQGNLWQLKLHPVALVRRGEDWRAAMRWLQARATAGDRVFVDSGLIEADRILTAGGLPQRGAGRARWDYLRFPTRGPYRLDAPTMPIRNNLVLPPTPPWTFPSGRRGTTFVVTRRGAGSHVQPYAPDLSDGWSDHARWRSFGRVWVITLPAG